MALFLNTSQIINAQSVDRTEFVPDVLKTNMMKKVMNMFILSFDLFCNECGAVLGKWDNTNREYFLGKREN